MRIPAKKRWLSPPPVGLSWDSPSSPPESVQAGRCTLTSQPKFLGSIVYQICIVMVLRWCATRAGSAIIICGTLNQVRGERLRCMIFRNNSLRQAWTKLQANWKSICIKIQQIVKLILFLTNCHAIRSCIYKQLLQPRKNSFLYQLENVWPHNFP